MAQTAWIYLKLRPELWTDSEEMETVGEPDLPSFSSPYLSAFAGRRCIQSICAFIGVQCRREKKDHTRLLHSLIINAFHCLGVWIVAHPNSLNDQETLRAVVETTKLGIFGDETAPLPQPGSKVCLLNLPDALTPDVCDLGYA